LLEPSREIVMGSKGGFYGLIQIMEDAFFEHSITFWWVRFAGKMPASNILYRILWVQEDERARIVSPAEENYRCSRD
jgi:hypothetical protein